MKNFTLLSVLKNVYTKYITIWTTPLQPPPQKKTQTIIKTKHETLSKVKKKKKTVFLIKYVKLFVDELV